MPIDNFKHSRRREAHKALDGFVNKRPDRANDISNFEPRRLAPQSSNNRQIGDFNKTEDFHSSRLMNKSVEEPSSLGEPAEQASSLLNKTLLNNRPLGSDTDHRHKFPRNWRKIRRRSMQTVLGLVIIAAVIVGFLFSKGYLKLHEVFKGGGTAVALQANVNPDLLKGEGSGRINILALGIGGAGHDGPDLTDTMLLVSIDPVNNKAVLLSIPRDLWVNISGNYYQKINAAYETGKYKYLGEESDSNANQNAIDAGFKSSDKVVSKVLGITINYNVLLDFQAFQQAVDTVGGISINVPTELYDPTIAWQNNNNPVIAKAGLQTMNGTKALLYVRSRETTSDFARTQRQRVVVLALKDKALNLGTLSNPLKISNLINAFGDNVRTDISLSDANSLYSIMTKINNNNFKSIGLADPPNSFVTTGDVDGLSVVEPTAGLFDYTDIQTYIRSTLVDGYISKENANIMILDGSEGSTLASKEAVLLKSYGYNIGVVANAPTQNYSKTVLVDLSHGNDKYTLHYLEERLGVTAVSSLPDKAIQPNNAKFVIIMGQNATTSS